MSKPDTSPTGIADAPDRHLTERELFLLNYLQKNRKKLNLKGLAEDAGFHYKTLDQFVSGKRAFPLTHLPKLELQLFGLRYAPPEDPFL